MDKDRRERHRKVAPDGYTTGIADVTPLAITQQRVCRMMIVDSQMNAYAKNTPDGSSYTRPIGRSTLLTTRWLRHG